MEQDVYLVIDDDERFIGRVSDVLNPGPEDEIQIKSVLLEVLQYVVESAIFGDVISQTNTFQIEIH